MNGDESRKWVQAISASSATMRGITKRLEALTDSGDLEVSLTAHGLSIRGFSVVPTTIPEITPVLDGKISIYVPWHLLERFFLSL